MKIEKCNRGGERNILETDSKPVGKFYDLTDYLFNLINTRLTSIINRVYDASYLSTETFIHNGNAEKTDFYPLDIELSPAERNLLLQREAFDSHGNCLLEPVELLLAYQVKNILQGIDDILYKNPNADVAIYFSPADTIHEAGKTAKPIYFFGVETDDGFTLQSESSWVILPV